MNDQRDRDTSVSDFDGSFEGTRRRQILAGLQLDHQGRLRWLEERMAELLTLKGKASAEPAIGGLTRPTGPMSLGDPSIAERVDELMDGFGE